MLDNNKENSVYPKELREVHKGLIIGLKYHIIKEEWIMTDRMMCLVCDIDFLPHQTVIYDDRKRCICLNCWNEIRRLCKKWQ